MYLNKCEMNNQQQQQQLTFYPTQYKIYVLNKSSICIEAILWHRLYFNIYLLSPPPMFHFPFFCCRQFSADFFFQRPLKASCNGRHFYRITNIVNLLPFAHNRYCGNQFGQIVRRKKKKKGENDIKKRISGTMERDC